MARKGSEPKPAKRWPTPNDLLAWSIFENVNGFKYCGTPWVVLKWIEEIQSEPKNVHAALYECSEKFRQEFLSPEESTPSHGDD